MSVRLVDGKFQHYPKGEKFEWDQEVAIAFPDMARRSIPLYEQMHRLHAMILLTHANQMYNASGRSDMFRYRIADVGASHGEFLSTVLRMQHLAGGAPLSLSAFEPSEAMRSHIERNAPGTSIHDIPLGENEIGCNGGFDAVACHYTLQFVEEEKQLHAIYELKNMVKPGGLLLFAQKDGYQDFVPDFIKGPINDHYLDFRRENGYTDQEIYEKTKALKGVMHTTPMDEIRHLFKPGFTIRTDTVRMGAFNAFVSVKDHYG